MRVIILKNCTTEGPGLIEDILIEKNIKYKIFDLDAGEKPPLTFNFDGVIVLGGPDSANDDTEKITNEIKFIQKVLSRKIPYLGICLGMQLLVKALGGRVIKAPLKEIGLRDPLGNFFEIELTEKGMRSIFLKSLPKRFNVFQLHGETVELIPKIDLLATGKFVTNQAVSFGNFAFGLQPHFEVSEKFFYSLIEDDEDLKLLDRKKLISDFEKIKESYFKTGKIIFSNFLSLLKEMRG